MAWQNKESISCTVLKDSQAQRHFISYDVSSRRDASIVPPLLDQGCFEPGASPQPQKKGGDLTCLNILHLIRLIWGLLLALSGFTSIYVVLLEYPGSTRHWNCLVEEWPAAFRNLFWYYSVLILIFRYPVCAITSQLCFLPLWLHVTLYT